MATVTEPGSGLLFGRFRKGLVMVALVTLLAGLLFGYDQGVISGALQFIADDFKLSDTLKEVVTSWVTLGALGGALLAGVLADKLGRKRALIIAGVLFVGGALVQSLAPGTGILVLGRFVIGLGVGVASVAAPLYAAEMAPAETTGPVRLDVPAGHHHGHLHRLHRRRLAGRHRRLAAHAGHRRGPRRRC